MSGYLHRVEEVSSALTSLERLKTEGNKNIFYMGSERTRQKIVCYPNSKILVCDNSISLNPVLTLYNPERKCHMVKLSNSGFRWGPSFAFPYGRRRKPTNGREMIAPHEGQYGWRGELVCNGDSFVGVRPHKVAPALDRLSHQVRMVDL